MFYISLVQNVATVNILIITFSLTYINVIGIFFDYFKRLTNDNYIYQYVININYSQSFAALFLERTVLVLEMVNCIRVCNFFKK